MIICTDHYYKKCKQRLGLNKRASKALLEKAIKYGLSFDDVKHIKNMKRYAYKIYKPANNINDSTRMRIIYKYYTFIIAIDDSGDIIGVTIYDVPAKTCKVMNKIYKKNKENKNNGYGKISPYDERQDQTVLSRCYDRGNL